MRIHIHAYVCVYSSRLLTLDAETYLIPGALGLCALSCKLRCSRKIKHALTYWQAARGEGMGERSTQCLVAACNKQTFCGTD